MNINTNPLILDSMTADYTMIAKGQPVFIQAVYFETSGTSANTFVLEDGDGNTVVRMTVMADAETTGATYLNHVATGKFQQFIPPLKVNNGLIHDASEGTYDGTTYALIYLA